MIGSKVIVQMAQFRLYILIAIFGNFTPTMTQLVCDGSR